MKVRKKPTIIDAVQWTGDNENEICDFAPNTISFNYPEKSVYVTTPEGIMEGMKGCYILKANSKSLGLHCWPVDAGYFEENYEVLDEMP